MEQPTEALHAYKLRDGNGQTLDHGIYKYTGHDFKVGDFVHVLWASYESMGNLNERAKEPVYQKQYGFHPRIILEKLPNCMYRVGSILTDRETTQTCIVPIECIMWAPSPHDKDTKDTKDTKDKKQAVPDFRNQGC